VQGNPDTVVLLASGRRLQKVWSTNRSANIL